MMPELVGRDSAVWLGGMGHRLITLDGDGPTYGVQCYRCGMAAEPDAAERAIPDCTGPSITGHHWTASGRDGRIECAYGDATSTADDWAEPVACTRA
jgi:hypothetical protein